MAYDKDKKSHKNHDDETDTGTGGESGSGGKSGQLEFHDFIATGAPLRDDLLPPDEKKRLLSVHNTTHEGRVKKQKDLATERNQLKEGKMSLKDYRQGLSAAGANSQYRSHPSLSDKAQFSGIDRQINALPNENVAESNKEQQNKLENAYRLRFAPESAPKFNPKPMPR